MNFGNNLRIREFTVFQEIRVHSDCQQNPRFRFAIVLINELLEYFSLSLPPISVASQARYDSLTKPISILLIRSCRFGILDLANSFVFQ